MDGYIGCQIRQINENCIVMHQSELINKMERIFREDINKLRSRDMPFGTNNRNARPKDEEVLISKEDQTKYWSGIGMLLYLVNYLRLDLSNAVHELPKVNDGATGLFEVIVVVLQGQSLIVPRMVLQAMSTPIFCFFANTKGSIRDSLPSTLLTDFT